jgi:hypothetical protein
MITVWLTPSRWRLRSHQILYRCPWRQGIAHFVPTPQSTHRLFGPHSRAAENPHTIGQLTIEPYRHPSSMLFAPCGQSPLHIVLPRLGIVGFRMSPQDQVHAHSCEGAAL